MFENRDFDKFINSKHDKNEISVIWHVTLELEILFYKYWKTVNL